MSTVTFKLLIFYKLFYSPDIYFVRYLSTLYSHTNWPDMSPGDMQEELKSSINSSMIWRLTPTSIYHSYKIVMDKKQSGQPVSITDLFGHMVGLTLLKNVSNALCLYLKFPYRLQAPYGVF